MPRAGATLSKCMRPNETGVTNEFYFGIDKMDGVDPWYTFIKSRRELTLSAVQKADFERDSWLGGITFGMHKPGVHSNVLDIDKDSYYIDIDHATGQIRRDANGNPIYKYYETGETVDWDSIKDKTETKYLIFTRKVKKLASAPSWYGPIKKSMLGYVDFLRETKPELMTKDGFNLLENEIKHWFNKIESGEGDQGWYNTIFNLFNSGLGNHWYLMSKIMPRVFDRMLSDQEVAENLLGYDFSNVTFREFSEAAAVYANKARGGNITVADALGVKFANKIYGKKTLKLFGKNEDGKIERLDMPEEGVITKDYLMSLNIDQQIEQIKFMLGKNAPTFRNFSMKMKINLWYNGWGRVLRFINFIGKPWIYSALMTFGKGMTGFMPLLILNSGMFVTEAMARGNRLNGDWKGLFNKWGLDDGLPSDIKGYSSGIGNTLADMSRGARQKSTDALNQGLFNIGDLMMENSYKVRQYQLFFEAVFPGIKDVGDIDRILTDMEIRDPAQLRRLLEAARQYTEYAVRLTTTNTPLMASLVRVHAAKNPLNQPMLDTWYVLWNFFSGWGFNKVMGAYKIWKTGKDNILQGKIGSKYVDDLLSLERSGLTGPELFKQTAEIRGKMVRTYLENEQFIYFLHKIYTALMIGKYLDRLSEDYGEKNTETLFEDFSDMFSFMDVFSGDYAALTANPQGRIVKNFLDMFIGELENHESIGTATKAGAAAAAKEFARSFLRKLYFPQIAVEYRSLEDANWDMEEGHRLRNLKKAIQDNVNGYMYYLKDTTENGEYGYYIPKGPNAYVNAILGKSPKSVEFVNDQKMLSKLANLSGGLFDDDSTFHNWVIYSFPFFKQWNMSQIPDIEGFIDDYDAFRATKEYNQMMDGELPDDITGSDYEYIYNIITRRLINDEDKINNKTLLGEYSFVGDDGEIAYDKNRQTQEYIIHNLMINGLTEDQAKDLVIRMEGRTNKYDEEAIRTLAYMEAKTPGSSLQAVAYLMSKERFDYVYRSGTKYEGKALEIRKRQGEIEAAKKYADYVPYVDRYYTWPQFILYYAKTHDTTLAKYIDGPGESGQQSMRLITPGNNKVDAGGRPLQNSMLKQNFQAQLMVDIEGANGNPDARKLMNGFALIFDTKKYENKDGTLQPKYAAYALNQLEVIYDHIDHLAIDENSKHILKQGTLMFGDRLYMNIVNDEKLSAREDVQTVLKDWVHYWYGEFRELDQIAIDAAEDQLSNKERKSYGAKKDYLTSGINKKFSGFVKWYDYMKDRAYNSHYIKYRVYDWTPRDYGQRYVTKLEYNQARMFQGGWAKPENKPSKGGKAKDDGIGFSLRRGKALQFYKREDPDKPVEYRLPRRKRWVKKGSGVKPISTTTWKHLTPKPKTNG